jgi:hypothetical protein
MYQWKMCVLQDCGVLFLMLASKITRDETAMEVDETEDEIRPKEVADYGIEVDFSDLEEDDREVRRERNN